MKNTTCNSRTTNCDVELESSLVHNSFGHMFYLHQQLLITGIYFPVKKNKKTSDNVFQHE